MCFEGTLFEVFGSQKGIFKHFGTREGNLAHFGSQKKLKSLFFLPPIEHFRMCFGS